MKPESITFFNIGDTIMRVEPMKYNSGNHEVQDFSFLNEPMILRELRKGIIILELINEKTIRQYGTNEISFVFDGWSEGWELCKAVEIAIEPIETENEKYSILNRPLLESLMQDAINNQNYELADEIKNKLR